jgi:5'-nucleotidase
VPPGPVRGFRFASLGIRTYGNAVVENLDPRGRKYYWIGSQAGWRDVPRSDCNAVFDEGLVAVTPLHLDLTHDGLLARMAGFSLPGYRKEPDP